MCIDSEDLYVYGERRLLKGRNIQIHLAKCNNTSTVQCKSDEEISEFDLPIDIYIDDNEILLPELIQMLRIEYIDLVNQLNLAYTGPVFFGTPLQGN